MAGGAGYALERWKFQKQEEDIKKKQEEAKQRKQSNSFGKSGTSWYTIIGWECC